METPRRFPSVPLLRSPVVQAGEGSPGAFQKVGLTKQRWGLGLVAWQWVHSCCSFTVAWGCFEDWGVPLSEVLP